MHLPVVIGICLSCLVAQACPEIVVPINPNDPALKARAWKGSFQLFRQRRFKAALSSFNKTSARLHKKATALFQPNNNKTVKNSRIQKWLQKYVYTKSPSVLIHEDRFTFPALVWWAWADTACRQRKYKTAALLLKRLRTVRPGSDLRLHEAMVAMRLGQLKAAKRMLAKAPPDGFVFPFLQGLAAAAEGKPALARKKFLEAKSGANLDDRRQAVETELARLNDG